MLVVQSSCINGIEIPVISIDAGVSDSDTAVFSPIDKVKHAAFLALGPIAFATNNMDGSPVGFWQAPYLGDELHLHVDNSLYNCGIILQLENRL